MMRVRQSLRQCSLNSGSAVLMPQCGAVSRQILHDEAAELRIISRSWGKFHGLAGLEQLFVLSARAASGEAVDLDPVDDHVAGLAPGDSRRGRKPPLLALREEGLGPRPRFTLLGCPMELLSRPKASTVVQASFSWISSTARQTFGFSRIHSTFCPTREKA